MVDEQKNKQGTGNLVVLYIWMGLCFFAYVMWENAVIFIVLFGFALYLSSRFFAGFIAALGQLWRGD